MLHTWNDISRMVATTVAEDLVKNPNLGASYSIIQPNTHKKYIITHLVGHSRHRHSETKVLYYLKKNPKNNLEWGLYRETNINTYLTRNKKGVIISQPSKDEKTESLGTFYGIVDGMRTVLWDTAEEANCLKKETTNRLTDVPTTTYTNWVAPMDYEKAFLSICKLTKKKSDNPKFGDKILVRLCRYTWSSAPIIEYKFNTSKKELIVSRFAYRA